ncbi:hypothetical protein CYMTET_56749 [Cymbomonas tetramitiformis]|uniref:Calmodulin n=1 Tax=Cymbomonas tetramitiformis TaxID=36881 RepID=A0AAE0BBT5_9CHLO|nr:hypothetical protein CYMTET_56749 [Cymbomonas tetramitiformis]
MPFRNPKERVWRAMFDNLDVFGAGYLDIGRVKDVLIDLGYTSTVGNMMEALDANRDGNLSFEEFCTGMAKCAELKMKLASPASKGALADLDVPVTTVPLKFPEGVRTALYTDNVFEVIRKMNDAKARSIPVVETKSKRLVGMLDCFDIVCFIATIAPLAKADGAAMGENLLEIYGDRLSEVCARDLMNYSGINQTVTLKETQSLRQAAELLLKKRVRRIPVINEYSEVVNVISQVTLVQFLQHNISLLASGDVGFAQLESSVEDLNLGGYGVVQVPMSSTVVQAVHKLARDKVTSTAVVDNDGRVQGHISSKDICMLLLENELSFSKMLTQKLSETSILSGRTLHKRKKYITAKPSTSLRDIAQRFVDSEFEVHRIFIADNHQRPIEMVSLLDILPYALMMER